MKFHYVASTQNGKITEGTAEAGSTQELLINLASQGLRPVSVKAMKTGEASESGRHVFGQKITITDKIFLTKYLAIMLKVGTDLFQAINILIADFEKPALRALLIEIRESLERGQPFYSTFTRYPKYFSPIFVNLVKSGEASGNLERVFEDLSEGLDKEKTLRSKIRGALVYPMILLGLSMLILIFLTTFALPRLANIFLSGGFKPPAFSRIVFAVGLFINKYIWGFIGLGAIIGISIFIFSRTLSGKNFFRSMLVRIPIIKGISYQLAIQRFATTLSSLLRAGVPIIDALTITAQTIGYPKLQDAVFRVATQGVAQGISLGEAFRRENAFPAVVTNLIAISEKAGHLEEILATLGRFYESEIDTSIKSAITFIEPTMLLFIGAIIGTVALAVIVPIYQLVGQL